LEYFATATEEEENDKLKKWRANQWATTPN
jgi:hypothetical protein